MKIGIMGTRGIPNNYGGFEQSAQHISLGLYARGHEVYVYNSSNHPNKKKEWNGVQIIHCKDWEHKMGTVGQFFYDLNCIRDARKRNFDILFHFGYSSDSIWCHRWPKNSINIVNMDGFEWKRAKYNRVTRKFLKWAESWAARKAQVMIADSPLIQDYIFETYGEKPVYIPYSAKIFAEPDPSVLSQYDLFPDQYFILVARMEPENNIEVIIRGYLASNHQYPLLVIGNIGNKFGKYLERRYHHANIKFVGAVYDQTLLNNLRYFSSIYFHGHSVGGTNPSLLEAMACHCNIAAHDNLFNKAVLGKEAAYFSTARDVSTLINMAMKVASVNQNKSINAEKIRAIYNPEKIADAYQELIVKAVQQVIRIHPVAVAG